MFKRFCGWLLRHPLALALGLIGSASSVFAEGSTPPAVDVTPFNTALTHFSTDLTTLVGAMAPAIVTVASITLIIVAVNWLVRKVRGAIGRG